MKEHQSEMYRCLRDLDVGAAMRLWKHIGPNMPQPENEYQAYIMIHYARTHMRKMPNHYRFYSHCWLRDEGLPSALPDNMKPKAERLYPVGVRAVGVASTKIGGEKTPFNDAIQKVMVDAVLETYADGHQDQPHIVRARILEKRAEFKRRA